MPSIFETDVALDALADTAIERTKALMNESDKLRDRREKANRKRVHVSSKILERSKQLSLLPMK